MREGVKIQPLKRKKWSGAQPVCSTSKERIWEGNGGLSFSVYVSEEL